MSFYKIKWVKIGITYGMYIVMHKFLYHFFREIKKKYKKQFKIFFERIEKNNLTILKTIKNY